ncbi:HlyC/CorC family transporter, partial [Listeria welshimeri]
VGMLRVSAVMAGLGNDETIMNSSIKPFISPVLEVFEGMALEELLVKMQEESEPFAVLTDEYGGTAGIVTLEDIMEVIVGDMEEAKGPKGIRKVAANHFIMAGSEPLIEVEETLGIAIDSHGVHTLSGWMLLERFDLEAGDEIEYEGYRFIVRSMNKNSIRQVEVKWKKEHPVKSED